MSESFPILKSDQPELKLLMTRIMNKFINSPRMEEAEVFGKNNFDLEVTGNVQSQVAPALSLKNLYLLAFDPWWPGSLKLSKKPLKILLYIPFMCIKILRDALLNVLNTRKII